MESWSVILVIGGVFLGIMAAGIAFVLFQRMLGALPRSLVELGAISPETAIVPRSSIGSDPSARPVFGIEVRERTALRACTIGGAACLVNGKIMCIQIPKT